MEELYDTYRVAIEAINEYYQIRKRLLEELFDIVNQEDKDIYIRMFDDDGIINQYLNNMELQIITVISIVEQFQELLDGIRDMIILIKSFDVAKQLAGWRRWFESSDISIDNMDMNMTLPIQGGLNSIRNILRRAIKIELTYPRI